jgi:hypothetical protein
VEARQNVTGVMEAFLRTQAGEALRLAKLRAWLRRVSVLDVLLRAFSTRLHDGENKLDEAQAFVRRLQEELAEPHCCALGRECPCYQDGYAVGVEMGQISVKEEGP